MPRTALSRRPLAARITSGLLALALASGLTLATAGPAMAVPITDVSVTTDHAYTFNSEFEQAQSFTAGLTGDLRTATFLVGTPGPGGPARLVNLVGGLPTGSTIATGAPSMAGNAVTYSFTGSATIVQGVKYAIVVPFGLGLQGGSDSYAGGAVIARQGATGLWVDYSSDFDTDFSTTVEPLAVDPVTGLTATSGDRAVTLAWSAPAAGATPASYTIQYRAIGTTAWTSAPSTTDLTATITGLTGGTGYDFSVSAASQYVSSTPVTTTATPYATATAPQNVTFTAGDETATLSWAAPADAGTNPITKYVVEVSNGSGTLAFDSTSTSRNFSGLTNGTTYSIQVFAVTADGNGAKSASVTATPSAFAEAPVLTVTEGDTTVDVGWTAPLSDGSAITQYEIEFSGQGATTTSTTIPSVREFSASGLTNGESYTARVRAYNSRGAGAWSALSTSVPRTIPGTPTAFVATPGKGTTQLNWVAPASNGGATIDSYAIDYREVGAAAWTTVSALGTATGIELTGLANGVAHEFRIAAVNEAGAGAATSILSATPFAASFAFTKPDGTSLAGERLPRGTKVVLTGTQLPEGASVSFELHSTPVVLGTGVVAADGTVTVAATIPADAAFGSHELVGLVTSQGVTVSTSVAVVVPLIVIPTGDGDLAVTGTDLLTGLNLAALLVLVGGALLMVARRRSIRIA